MNRRTASLTRCSWSLAWPKRGIPVFGDTPQNGQEYPEFRLDRTPRCPRCDGTPCIAGSVESRPRPEDDRGLPRGKARQLRGRRAAVAGVHRHAGRPLAGVGSHRADADPADDVAGPAPLCRAVRAERRLRDRFSLRRTFRHGRSRCFRAGAVRSRGTCGPRRRGLRPARPCGL